MIKEIEVAINLENLGSTLEAQREYTSVFFLNKNNWRALAGISRCCGKLKDYASALEASESFKNLFPNKCGRIFYLNYAFYLYKNGKIKESIKNLGWTLLSNLNESRIESIDIDINCKLHFWDDCLISKNEKKIQIKLSKNFFETLSKWNLERLDAILHVISECKFIISEIPCSLGDIPRQAGTICFSSNFSDSILVPDPYYIKSQGYQDKLRELEKIPEVDSDIAFWRGRFCGVHHQQRMMLVDYSFQNPTFLDARFSKIQSHFSEIANSYKDSVAPPVPFLSQFNRLVQIDVDGNSNAWDSFFLKLASGRPLIKIKSRMGYRQWYYERVYKSHLCYFVEYDLSNFSVVYGEILNQFRWNDYEKNSKKFIREMNFSNEIMTCTENIRYAVNKNII